ncbi:hypothetical protein ACQP3C_30545, partial [Escherichia coli]
GNIKEKEFVLGSQFQMVGVRDGGMAGPAESSHLQLQGNREKAHWEWSFETSKPTSPSPVTCFLLQTYAS